MKETDIVRQMSELLDDAAALADDAAEALKNCGMFGLSERCRMMRDRYDDMIHFYDDDEGDKNK